MLQAEIKKGAIRFKPTRRSISLTHVSIESRKHKKIVRQIETVEAGNAVRGLCMDLKASKNPRYFDAAC